MATADPRFTVTCNRIFSTIRPAPPVPAPIPEPAGAAGWAEDAWVDDTPHRWRFALWPREILRLVPGKMYFERARWAWFRWVYLRKTHRGWAAFEDEQP